MLNPLQLKCDLQAGTNNMNYMLRTCLLGSWLLAMPPALDILHNRAYAEHIHLYKTKQRPILRGGNQYHIFPFPDGSNYDGMQYYNDGLGKGSVLVFKPAATSPNSTTVRLKGLHRASSYKLSYQDRANLDTTASGALLMDRGLVISGMDDPEASEIIWIEEVPKRPAPASSDTVSIYVQEATENITVGPFGRRRAATDDDDAEPIHEQLFLLVAPDRPFVVPDTARAGWSAHVPSSPLLFEEQIYDLRWDNTCETAFAIRAACKSDDDTSSSSSFSSSSHLHAVAAATTADCVPVPEPTVSVTVLPGGAIQMLIGGTVGALGAAEKDDNDAPAATFIVRSSFTEPGPVFHTFGTAQNESDWTVAVEEQRPGRLWKVAAKATSYTVSRTVSVIQSVCTPTRINVSDTIKTLPNAVNTTAVVGIEARHVLVFPQGAVVTDALVPGTQYVDDMCSSAGNLDLGGLHRGSFGNPTVFATTGNFGAGLLPLDDVFETHAHGTQRAFKRRPGQPEKYKPPGSATESWTFPDCPVTDPPEIEIADPMLGLKAGGTRYTQEWAAYLLAGNCTDYYCFINQVREDITPPGADTVQTLYSGWLEVPSDKNPIVSAPSQRSLWISVTSHLSGKDGRK